MSYNRPPTPGTALKQIPSLIPPGSVLQILDANISSTTELGVVQVGSGLQITPQGVLSVTGSGYDCCFMKVYLTSKDYTATEDDCYIGAIEHYKDDKDDDSKKDSITITLPKAITGKMYTVKNQDKGNVKVQGTDGQKIDTSTSKTLGSQSSITVVFDGTRWNTI
jgi:hypothetical protein